MIDQVVEEVCPKRASGPFEKQCDEHRLSRMGGERRGFSLFFLVGFGGGRDVCLDLDFSAG